MPTRIFFLDWLRIFATVSVIFIHAGAMLMHSGGNESDVNLYEYVSRCTNYAVPVFLLISGALLLNPQKELGYRRIFIKYVSRIIRILLLFGLPMCMLETYVLHHDWTLLKTFLVSSQNVITGNCWSHMWYLYMLVGIYALTPLFKAFIQNSQRKELQYLLCVLFIMGVIPYIKYLCNGLVESYITLPIYLFLYVFGYYLRYHVPASNVVCFISVVIVLAYLLQLAFCVSNSVGPYLGYDPQTLTIASALFLLAKRYVNVPNRLVELLSVNCLGIYITHAVFLNVFFKVLHVDTLLSSFPIVNVLMIVFVSLFMALVTTMLLRRNRWIRENVL